MCKLFSLLPAILGSRPWHDLGQSLACMSSKDRQHWKLKTSDSNSHHKSHFHRLINETCVNLVTCSHLTALSSHVKADNVHWWKPIFTLSAMFLKQFQQQSTIQNIFSPETEMNKHITMINFMIFQVMQSNEKKKHSMSQVT